MTATPLSQIDVARKPLVTKARFLIAFAVVLFLSAWNRDMNLLYVLFSLIISTLLVSAVVPRLASKAITVERGIISPAAFEDDSVTVRLALENRSRRGRFMLEVIDSIPAAEPALRKPMIFVARLKGKERKEYEFSFSAFKRGAYTFGPIAVRSSYPLGVASVDQVAGERLQFTVYPRIFDIPFVPLLTSGSIQQTGVEALSKTGGSDEFYGTREYKTGDSLKYIHWPLSAKHMAFIVKEFEIRGSTQVMAILDFDKRTNLGTEKDTTFEYALKIAVSIGKYALERGHAFQAIGYGKDSQFYSSSSRLEHLDDVLDGLARVEADGEIAYPAAITHSADLISEGSTVVLFLTRWNHMEDYLYPLRLLEVKRASIIAVFFDGATFDGKKTERSPRKSALAEMVLNMGGTCHFASKGDCLPDMFVS